MPRRVPQDELDEIVHVIAVHPSGLGRDTLAGALSGRINARTLQRRLRQLVQANRIFARREQRLVRYLVPAAGTATGPGSVAGEARPGQPASYDPALLAAYRFQRTRQPYLDSAHHDRLHALAAQWRGSRSNLNPSMADAQRLDCAWGSACLDGCTYTRAQFDRLIKEGTPAAGKPAIESQSALNHLGAMRYAAAAADRREIDRAMVLEAHALLSDGLLDDPGEGGRVRDAPLALPGSLYRPLASRQRLEELLDATLSVARGIDDPFEQAFFLLVHLGYLQPFAVANSAVARLIANVALLRGGHCPISYVGLSSARYNQGLLDLCEFKRIEPLRDLFIGAFESSCRRSMAAREAPLSPAAFRVQHRAALDEAVRALIHGGMRADEQAVGRIISAKVAPADHDRFSALVLTELRALHAGNAVRFGLRPDELQRWKDLQ